MYGLELGIIRSKLAFTSRREAKKPSTNVASRQATTTRARLLKIIRSKSPPDVMSKSRRSGTTGIPLLYFCSTIFPISQRVQQAKSVRLGNGDNPRAGKQRHDQLVISHTGKTRRVDLTDPHRLQRGNSQGVGIDGNHLPILANDVQLAALLH